MREVNRFADIGGCAEAATLRLVVSGRLYQKPYLVSTISKNSAPR